MIVSGPPGRLTSATMAVDRTKFLFWAPQLSVQKKFLVSRYVDNLTALT